MNALTAVDVLLTPDESMVTLAERFNARMLTSVPAPTGFALDEHHRPHITTLQRYVRTESLDQVYAAISGVLAAVDLSALKLTAHSLAHIAVQPPTGWQLRANHQTGKKEFLFDPDRNELQKYAAALNDPRNTEMRGVETVTNNHDSVAYWRVMMAAYGVKGYARYVP
ncbi:restriction endonuclease fold toxin-2 domain-containing protein [Streptomyces goshikiensis]|uniref:restriction endonuclease fold toxin-2 domain-containing protein n=1 Tax=Streptomyces goshikiensis TaxID=1942 RepID=UPI0036A37FCF